MSNPHIRHLAICVLQRELFGGFSVGSGEAGGVDQAAGFTEVNVFQVLKRQQCKGS